MDEHMKVTIFLISAYFAIGAALLRFAIPFFLFPTTELEQPTFEVEKYTIQENGLEIIARSYGMKGTPCLFFFPGQHGGITRYEREIANNTKFKSFNTIILSYPSQDGASGKVTNLEAFNDLVVQLINKTKKDSDCSKTFFYGRSLGAMLAANVSVNVNSQGIILESVALSLDRAIETKLQNKWYLYPYQILPIKLLLPHNYIIEDLLQKQKTANILIVQGNQDSITPLNQIEDVVTRNRISLLKIENGNHSSTFSLAQNQISSIISHWSQQSE